MPVQVVDVEEVQKLLGEGVVYVDVRSPQEFIAGHVPDSLNIPVAIPDPNTMQMALNPDFVSTMEEQFEKGSPVIVACKMGGRSRHACALLEHAGFTALRDFSGGWSGRTDPYGNTVVPGWASSGLEVETGGGS